MLFALALLACQSVEGPPLGDPAGTAGETPPIATMHRLTDPQWRASVASLTGVAFTGALPADLNLQGYTVVGGSVLTIASSDEDMYEGAAWAVAAEALPDTTGRDAALGCALEGVDVAETDACIRGYAAQVAHRAWHRPLTTADLDGWTRLYHDVDAIGGPTLGAQAVLAGILSSSEFLFRVETGERDPQSPSAWRYTDHELAARLSFLLTNTVPDDALLDAADAGELTTVAGLRAEAERLLATPAARDVLAGFWTETLEVASVGTAQKDGALYPQFDPTLAASMQTEIDLLVKSVLLDQDRPVPDLFTTNETFVDARLAPIYGLTAAGDAFEPQRIAEEQERGGVLGRAAFLAAKAGATRTSPTKRGKWIATRLLCEAVPPPPAGIPALDATPQTGTLRDQLEQHMADPSCASCHQIMDPLGFGLERFDAIGQWRALDNGLPIDATGELEGVAFDGAVGLADTVVANPRFTACIATQLLRYGIGMPETTAQQGELDALAADFEADGLSFRALVLDFVVSDAFRYLTPPAGDACDTAGAMRGCTTACGGGMETCVDGAWQGCDAPAPRAELCNGRDDDCDGAIDAIEDPCELGGAPGLSVCDDGAWSACAGPAAAVAVEECNGRDDDGDGLVDEALGAFVYPQTAEALAAAHSDCNPDLDGQSGSCHAAANRACAGSGCAVTGFGPVENTTDGYELTCLDAATATVVNGTYSELSGYHGGCTSGTPIGPDCNAAIHRWCAGAGMTTGYGPVEYSGDTSVYFCTPGATVIETGYSVLQGYDSGCNGSTERWGPACARAFHRFCAAQGFTSGYGPLENTGDTAYAACVGGA